MRVVVFQLFNQARQYIEHRRRNCPNGQNPRLAGHGFFNGQFQTLQLLGEFTHRRQNRRAHRGQFCTAPGAIKQLDLKRLLKHLNLLA